MSLVLKPSKVIGQFKGHEIVLRSTVVTENYEKFEEDAREFQMLLEESLELPLYGKEPS